MHRRTTAHLVASLFTLAALVGACASSSPPPDPGPPPVPTTDAPPAATSTAAVAATSTASAQPTYDPVMTGASAATAAPTASAAASASAAPAASASPAATAAPTASAASGPAGANLRVGSMTVDGLTVEDLACRADGLGMLGSMIVAGGIAKKKAALVACAPKGDKPRVEWTAAKGKVAVTAVKASTPAVEACVKKALAGTPAPFEGECAATLVLGK